MTARYALRLGTDGGCVLVSKPRKRAAFALGFLVLLGGMVAGFDPAADLAPARAPFTVLYLLLLLSCLGGSLSVTTAAIAPGARQIQVRRKIGGVPVGVESIEVAAGSELAVRRSGGERGPYSLELRSGGEARVLDASSWVSELEPVGRAVADTLGIPFFPAVASGGTSVLP
jgi:hypothetical protein